jgi:hypothetical protein
VKKLDVTFELPDRTVLIFEDNGILNIRKSKDLSLPDTIGSLITAALVIFQNEYKKNPENLNKH